jgi:hypothetical protein
MPAVWGHTWKPRAVATEHRSLSPLGGFLLRTYTAGDRFWPEGESAKDHAEREFFALYFAGIGVGFAAGLTGIALLNGVAFRILFVVICGWLGYVVGAGVPLQVVMRGEGRPFRGRPALWRWGVPLAGASAAALVALLAGQPKP